MVDKLQQQKLYPYAGSEDLTKNPLLISPTDIIESDNIIYTTYSTKKKRPGLSQAFAKLAKMGRRVLGIKDFWRLGVQRVVVWDGQYLWSINPITSDLTNITGDNKLPIDQTVSFEAFYGFLIIFFGGGQTPIKSWNQTGTIVDLISTPTIQVPHPETYYVAPFGRLFLNRLVIPDPIYKGRMLLSATNDPQDFEGADATAVDCGINDGDPVGPAAIFPEYYGNLYIGKWLSIWQISPITLDDGSIFFKPVKITGGVGCISHNGVAAVENDIFFPSHRGVHSLISTRKFAQFETDFKSLKIQNLWTKNVNFKRSQYIQSIYDIASNAVLWIYPSSSYNYPTEVLGYSMVSESVLKVSTAAMEAAEVNKATIKWFRWQSYNQTAIASYVDPNTKTLTTLVGDGAGNLSIIDPEAKTDLGKPINIFLQSGIICASGAPDDTFEFDFIMPIFVPQTSGTFRIMMKVDGKVTNDLTFSMKDDSISALLGSTFVMGQSYLGGTPIVKFDKRRIGGNGMTYQLFITHEQAENEDPCDFELLGVMMDIDMISKTTGTKVA